MTNIEAILNMDNLSEKQKSVLLGSIADELIENKKNIQEDPMAKHDMVAEKNRKHTEELRKKIKGYEEKHRKEEEERLRNLSLKEKLSKLATLKNRGGEPLYTEDDLKSMKGFEIEHLYSTVFERNNIVDDEKSLDNNTDIHAKEEIDKEIPELDYDLLEKEMSVDEMNTILNMYASGNIDVSLLKTISDRLGVNVSDLEKIATLKDESLIQKENDVASSSDNSSSNENEDKDNDKEKSEKTPSSDFSSSDAAETGAEAIEPEERKKPTALKTAGEKLKSVITKHKGKALAAMLGIAGIAALVLINPTMLLYALGAAGLGKIYKDFQAGAKGK